MRNLNQALKHELVLKKVHMIIKFNKKTWLKSYIDMKTDLKKTKNDFERYFFNWGVMQFLEKQWKMWENEKIANL